VIIAPLIIGALVCLFAALMGEGPIRALDKER